MPGRPAASEADDVARFLREAGVAPGARLLDAPCGLGRRARDLGERGYRVVAVDPNEVAVASLRKRAGRDLGSRLEYRAAPFEALPDLPAAERFDAILCLDHAIGHDPPREDAAVLGRFRSHLSPGGLLLLDQLNRDFFAARPRPFAYHVLGTVEQHEFRTFDGARGVLDLVWKFYQQEGEDLRFRGSTATRLALRTPDAVAALLEAAGWDVEGPYGGWGKEPLSADRRKVLFVARPRGVK